jgi:hypothetical protein
MGALRGALLGTLAVSALDVAVRTSSGASKLGGAFTGLATALNYVISPDLPLIPAFYLPNGGGKNSGVSVLGGAVSQAVHHDDPLPSFGYGTAESFRNWLDKEL